ncbi:PspC family transcriptional regulator [Empedobacter falsenii]|uniref:PspC family transcriptional regulator n=1 Tax=Empedobacter falsenii TaxID=343874 RepID=UPI002575F182|nr:PspC family transcriptional regulator [Empedobacter falsenii]MDM1061148.1 PspC family transcriptional regulator [Empedobacter falsenii]
MKDQIRNFTETEWFNVISRFADKLGIRVSKLRLIFIYLTFATFGLTFVGYFIMLFFFWVKDCFVIKRKSVFDL